MNDRTPVLMRHVDRDAFVALAGDQRVSRPLLDRDSGTDRVSVNLIRTPLGGGSPEGLHVHAYEQFFYVLEGTMHVEIGSESFLAPPGSLIVFPEGVPHRNWAREEPTLHLSINVPGPAAGAQVAIPVTREGSSDHYGGTLDTLRQVDTVVTAREEED